MTPSAAWTAALNAIFPRITRRDADDGGINTAISANGAPPSQPGATPQEWTATQSTRAESPTHG